MNNPVTRQQIMQQRDRIPASQAAGIEHSRAIAEVQAAVLVAQQCPRNEPLALQKAIESCRQMEVAEAAFYKFPRGGETVSGETIALAVELARCWGNIDYGIMELSRNDGAHESEMLAFAWDLESNTKARMTFIVPHKRDKRGGAQLLTDMRDIYENNANNGARRLRECIYRVLPPYLKEQAKRACYATLEAGASEKPLQVSVAEAIAAFKETGVSVDRLETKFGPSTAWTPADLAQLRVSLRSIKRREVDADEEFPRSRAAAGDDVANEARQIADKSKAKGRGKQADEPATGRTDEQHGDQNDGDETAADHPAQAIAANLVERCQLAQILGDVLNVEADFKPHRDAMPEDLAATVDAAINEARARFGKGK